MRQTRGKRRFMICGKNLYFGLYPLALKGNTGIWISFKSAIKGCWFYWKILCVGR